MKSVNAAKAPKSTESPASQRPTASRSNRYAWTWSLWALCVGAGTLVHSWDLYLDLARVLGVPGGILIAAAIMAILSAENFSSTNGRVLHAIGIALALALAIWPAVRLPPFYPMLANTGNDPCAGQARDPLPSLPDAATPGFTVVPAGDIFIGSTTQANERPQHPVQFTRAFAMSTCEITIDQYYLFIQATGRTWAGTSQVGVQREPAAGMTWHEAVAYADWLSSETDQRYRLPTEAEWEYAARAANIVVSGSRCTSPNTANAAPNAPTTECQGYGKGPLPAGTTPRNESGFYDMFGNVAEWTADCYQPTYENAPADGSAIESWRCPERTFRGGSWLSYEATTYPQHRAHASPEYRDYFLGFRVVRELSDGEIAQLSIPPTAPQDAQQSQGVPRQ